MTLDRSKRVPEQVHGILRDRILTGHYAPGETLNERGLTEMLGVSRTPIREAIRRLAGEGLIEVIPSVGCRVTSLDARHIGELATVRIELECLVIRRAAARFDAASGRRLLDLIERQQVTMENGDFLTNISVDSQFHRVIWDLSAMPTVADILSRTLDGIFRARHLSIQIPGRLDAPIREHRRVLAALESGDPSHCDTAMRAHLTESSRSITDALGKS